MNTPRTRFTVMPFLMAFLAGLAFMPVQNVVNVHASGMGIEHEQPWTRPSSPLRASITAARAVIARLGVFLGGLQRHALFKPVAATAMGLTLAYLQPEALIALPFVMGTTLTEGQHAGEFLLGERSDGGARATATVLSGQDLAAGEVVGRVKLGIGRVSIPTVSGTGNGTVSAVFPGPEVQVGNYVVTCTAAAANAGTFSVTCPDGKVLPSATVAVAYTSRHINFTIADGGTDYIVGDSFTFVVSTTVPTVIGGTGTGVLSALSLGPDAKPGRYKINNDVVVANGGDMTVIGPDGNAVGGRFIWSASGSTASFTSRQINFTISDATDYIANNYFDVCVFNQLAGGKVVEWDPTTFDGRHKVAGILYDNVDATSADVVGALVVRDAVVIKDALQWSASITSAQKESAYAELAALGIVAR
jgi:hypothetical protein